MRIGRSWIAVLASASLGLSVAAPAAASAGYGVELFEVKRNRQPQRLGGGVCRQYRNRWSKMRPKKRSNMNHVSKRVRRRHRRARKAA